MSHVLVSLLMLRKMNSVLLNFLFQLRRKESIFQKDFLVRHFLFIFKCHAETLNKNHARDSLDPEQIMSRNRESRRLEPFFTLGILQANLDLNHQKTFLVFWT